MVTEFQIGDFVTFIHGHPLNWRRLFPMWETGMEITGIRNYESNGRAFEIKYSTSTISDYNVRLLYRGGPW